MFGDIIRNRREELGLVQEELAAKIDLELSRQSISSWEKGEAYPRVEKLLVLASVLDLSLDTMFSEELDLVREVKWHSSEFQEKEIENTYSGLVAGLTAFSKALRKLNERREENDA